MCLWLLNSVCGTFSSLTSQVHVPITLSHGGSYLERAPVRPRGHCCGFPVASAHLCPEPLPLHAAGQGPFLVVRN